MKQADMDVHYALPAHHALPATYFFNLQCQQL